MAVSEFRKENEQQQQIKYIHPIIIKITNATIIKINMIYSIFITF
jgi:hypothetical protein